MLIFRMDYTLLTIDEAACAFAVYVYLMEDEHEDHLEEAQKYCMYCMSACLLSFVAAINSLIPLRVDKAYWYSIPRF
jgi:hypothetical protein